MVQKEAKGIWNENKIKTCGESEEETFSEEGNLPENVNFANLFLIPCSLFHMRKYLHKELLHVQGRPKLRNTNLNFDISENVSQIFLKCSINIDKLKFNCALNMQVC